MIKNAGDPLKTGEPLAKRKTMLGLLTRTARSPVEGRLVAAAGGRALVAAIARPYELRAGVPGSVVTILQAQGVVIETTGALLEGVWGNGGEDFAPLRLLGDSAAAVLTAEMAEVDLRGALVAAGVLEDPAVLKKLAGLRVRGLVLGSLTSALLPAVRKLDIPVLVVDSFGGRGFSTPAYSLLQGSAGREAVAERPAGQPFYRPPAGADYPAGQPVHAAPAAGRGQVVGGRPACAGGARAGRRPGRNRGRGGRPAAAHPQRSARAGGRGEPGRRMAAR